MSGFEIAGIVLGGFPILIKCLGHYREGLEPLEEWWNFRTHFIAFVDDIGQQMMLYNGNMIRLLDPIIADAEDLSHLVKDTSLTDPRWRNGSLDEPLKQRLGSESDRFFRILSRMKEAMDDLERLLKIEIEKPWQWHLKRLRISFSKGKHKKVRKLADCNQALQEILGYRERVVPIADKRKSSEPVRLFEKIRQHACGVYNAFKQQWRCDRGCQPEDHEAHLGLDAVAVSVSLDVVFILGGGPDGRTPSWRRVQIAPTEAAPEPAADISDVQHSALLAGIQQTMIQQNAAARKHNLRNSLPLKFQSMRSSLKAPSAEKSVQAAVKNVTFEAIAAAGSPATSVNASGAGVRTASPQAIADLCLFLADLEPQSGVLRWKTDRCFRLDKLVKDPGAPAAGEVQLVPLPELMAAHHHALINIPRQRRFEMAMHIASVLLQAHTSPWLPDRWAKSDFYFLVDTKSVCLCSTTPFFSRSFHPAPPPVTATGSQDGGSAPSEDRTRACLFTVGVMILELIFGHNLEDCQFREEYYGKDNKPNDQTDVCTARRWAEKVLGESGANVADVVRRCLNCSFGPKPNFSDVRFRESVYEAVVKPLAEYSKAWPEVMP